MAVGSALTPSRSTKKARTDGLDEKNFECTQLVHKHLFLLSCTQAEVFTAFDGKVKESRFDFFDISSLNVHCELTKQVVASLDKHRPYSFLEKAYALWTERLVLVALRSSEQERYGYSKLAKFIASFLLLAGEYDRAIICLGHAVQLCEGDYSSRFLLLQWLCYLGEWELAKAQLDIEDKLPKSNNSYATMIKIFSFIVEFNTNDNKEPVVKEILKLLEYDEEFCATRNLQSNGKKPASGVEKTNQKPVKTFMQYQCDAIVCRFLAVAARLPNAALNKIGDPLKNWETAFSRVHTLLRNRYKQFSDYTKPVDLQKQSSDSDGFLKLCSNIADYSEFALELCREHLETGNIRECENGLLILWQRQLRMAVFPRLLSVVNQILHVSLLSSASHFRFENLGSVASAMFSAPYSEDKRSDELGVTGGTAEVVHSSCSSLRNIFGKFSPSRNKKVSETEKQKFLLGLHKDGCHCVLCFFAGFSMQFRFHLEITQVYLDEFDAKSYLRLKERFHDLNRYAKTWTAKAKEALNLKECRSICKKDYSWLPIRELFLTITVRWLRSQNVNECGESIVKSSLELCETTPWHYRWQWLILRHLMRQAVDKPAQLDWLSDSLLNCSIGRLANDLEKMSLHTPNIKSCLRSAKAKGRLGSASKSSGKKCPTPARNTLNSVEDFAAAQKDFCDYRHIFYREWRFLICTYLSQIYSWRERDMWNAAYMLAEASTCATRQIARSLSADASSFQFENVAEFQKAVERLPSDLTVVQLFLDGNRILWLVRLSYKQSPLIVPVKVLARDDDLLKRMRELLIENDHSGKLAKTSIDSKQFWTIRRELDNRLERIIKDVEHDWFHVFAPLLLPHATFTDEGYAAIDEIRSHCKLSEESAKVLVESFSTLSWTDWQKLAERLAQVEGDDSSRLQSLKSLFGKMDPERYRLIDHNDRKYLLFTLSPELACFPFEMLPILGENQRVCRIPSLYLFQRLYLRSSQIPKCVDGQKTFYVLDPGGDLTDTQNRLSKMLQQHILWKGIIGQPPKPEEFRQYLQNNDFFLYMGHGSGGRYFGKSVIRSSDCRAVSVLMGCSSVRILHEGEGFDGQSVIYDYSVARCPCLVGCLWMVTDGEIDRYLMALVKYCFSNAESKATKLHFNESESYRLLIDAVAYARNACKLRYMTGGAVVSYGLPIVARNAPAEGYSKLKP